MIAFDKNVCSNISRISQHEWLETNGLGGFASSTLCGMNTRRYHGLLVAALAQPVRRFVLLSKYDETLILDGARIDLGSNQYTGAIHPQGYQFLARFEKRFFPVFTFQVGEWCVRKTVFMLHERHATCVEYAFESPKNTQAQFDVRPLLAYRDHHSLTRENASLYREVETAERRTKFSPYLGLPPLQVHHSAGNFIRDGFWFNAFQYDREQDRGLDYLEDLYSPGYFRTEIKNGDHLWFLAEADLGVDAPAAVGSMDFETIKADETKRRESLLTGVNPDEGNRVYLRLAADQFLVRRGKRSRSVIAGYPWFTDWGRDTMIAIPGLLFVTKNFEAARDILLTFAAAMRDGLIPNRFPDHPERDEQPEYNTADATLWFFHLAYDLAERTGDLEFIKHHLYELLLESFEWHRRGTRFHIHMSEDSLLSAGTERVQLTWMDAKIGDWVVTPRQGKAVDVCALWCNALRVLEFFARKLGDKPRARQMALLASQAEEAFNRLFWNPKMGYLNDVVNKQGADAALRPNQLLAISLPFGPLDRAHRRSVMSAVTEHLLTPFGLRTLAKNDPHYRGIYRGDQYERDSAYHQGTVWPWLLGPYATAYLNTYTHTSANKRHIRTLLEPLLQYMVNQGVGQLPELFDGDVQKPPDSSYSTPGKGCFAQAWSVAEIHRVLAEET
jgi:predicted glycogen debranching enzyme